MSKNIEQSIINCNSFYMKEKYTCYSFVICSFLDIHAELAFHGLEGRVLVGGPDLSDVYDRLH